MKEFFEVSRCINKMPPIPMREDWYKLGIAMHTLELALRKNGSIEEVCMDCKSNGTNDGCPRCGRYHQ